VSDRPICYRRADERSASEKRAQAPTEPRRGRGIRRRDESLEDLQSPVLPPLAMTAGKRASGASPPICYVSAPVWMEVRPPDGGEHPVPLDPAGDSQNGKTS
jgi:hypothetical protein